MTGDIEKPMGNAELRLSLASIETEIVEVKVIANRGLEQALKTNGKVMWHTKTIWLCMGALPLLTVWAGWLTLQILSAKPDAQEIQAAVNAGISQAFTNVKK